MSTKITDPITGDNLIVYGCDRISNEVYRANEDKVVATLIGHFGMGRDEAIRLISNSDIDNPVIINTEDFWVE